MDRGPFHKVCDRFKLFLIQCPYHSFPLQLHNQFFYDGLVQEYQYIINNDAGEAKEKKIVEQTYKIYEMLGINSQQKDARGRRVEVNKIGFKNETTLQL